MDKPKNILVTGGSGMIGNRLTTFLLEKGYSVSHLGRAINKSSVRTFLWDPYKGKLDPGALHGVDVVVHLAGAGIADKRWNARRKEEILLSRTQPTRFLIGELEKETHGVTAFISASGISYYGLEDRERAFVESDTPARDFLAEVTVAWEAEVDKAAMQGLRVVKIRTGAVLSRTGGALPKLARPVRFLVGAPLGSGRQVVNWIHIDDLCRMYIKAIEDTSMSGAYNAVAPNPVANAALTREIASVLKRPLWLPPIPGVVVKLIAGEVAEFVLKGGKVSSEKIQRAGFQFQFDTIGPALKDLLT